MVDPGQLRTAGRGPDGVRAAVRPGRLQPGLRGHRRGERAPPAAAAAGQLERLLGVPQRGRQVAEPGVHPASMATAITSSSSLPDGRAASYASSKQALASASRPTQRSALPCATSSRVSR